MPKNQNFKSYLKNPYRVELKLENINEKTVTDIIDKMANKSSCGFDNISLKMLKLIKDAIIKPLVVIINQMLKTGIFPDKLRLAKIVPILKKDDDSLFTNYRPISLLPAISKVFEKVIYKQLYNFFQSQKNVF